MHFILPFLILSASTIQIDQVASWRQSDSKRRSMSNRMSVLDSFIRRSAIRVRFQSSGQLMPTVDPVQEKQYSQARGISRTRAALPALPVIRPTLSLLHVASIGIFPRRKHRVAICKFLESGDSRHTQPPEPRFLSRFPRQPN